MIKNIIEMKRGELTQNSDVCLVHRPDINPSSARLAKLRVNIYTQLI